MLSKTYFACIGFLQETFLAFGIGILVVVPILLAYFSEALPEGIYTLLFAVSLTAVFLVMIVRPLADLFPSSTWLRPLVILRKGIGVFSASIIVAIMCSRLLVDGVSYLQDFFSFTHWSLTDWAVLAPLGDLSALVLLVTSNKFSKRVLGKNWKRIQKLSYVYFYAGALYEYVVFGQILAAVAVCVVTGLVILAYVHNRTTRS